MEINFYKTRQETRTVKETINLGEFYALLLTYKPREIFNLHYSSKTPCYYITEYINANTVMYYANAWVDKTPQAITIEKLYNMWRIEGLDNCVFFHAENEDYGQGKTKEQYEFSHKVTIGAVIALGILIGSYFAFKVISGT